MLADTTFIRCHKIGINHQSSSNLDMYLSIVIFNLKSILFRIIYGLIIVFNSFIK